MPDGEFFSHEAGFEFSKEDSGITLTEDNEDGYTFDVAFVKPGEQNLVFTESEFEALEREPYDTFVFFQIPQEELAKARAFLNSKIGLDEDHMLELHDDGLSL